VLEKAQQAVEDTEISGVKTNLSLLTTIVAGSSFQGGEGLIDTLWLENNAARLIESGTQISTTDIKHKTQNLAHISESSSDPATRTEASMASTILRKGDAWSINLQRLDPQGRQHSEKDYFISTASSGWKRRGRGGAGLVG
jgi:acetyl/propionyl-CoA carboxylase alpha subunit